MGDLSWSLLKKAKEDVRGLLRSFQSTGSLRFSEFSKVWVDAKFSLIFRKKQKFIELLEFSEEVINIAKDYLSPAHEFPIRVGALYVLYGLYFKQPLKEPVKIRLIRSEWENLCELIEQCKRENHIDAVFIHLKLFIKQAYLFTATERTMGLELGYRKYYSRKYITKTGSNKLDDLSLKPIIEPGLLEKLGKMASLYCKTKSEAAGNSDPQLVDENFAKYLKERCLIYNREKQKVNENDSDSDSETEDINDPDWDKDLIASKGKRSKSTKSSIGAKRTQLKSKGFTSQNKKAFEKVNSEPESVEASPVKNPKVARTYRIARKKAEVLSKQKEASCSLNLEPGQSSSHDLDIGAHNTVKKQEDNLTLPQL